MNAHDNRMSRRTLMAASGAIAGLGAVGAGQAEAKPKTPKGASWSKRATDTYALIRKYFHIDNGSHLYHERYPYTPDAGDRYYSFEWPFSQVHGASLDLLGMRGATKKMKAWHASDQIGQTRYWQTAGSTGLPGHASYPVAPWAGGGDFFYDDNEWVALIALQRVLMGLGSKADIVEAKAVFELVVSGWDTDPNHPAPGGVFWTQAPWSQDRNTVSNMPGAEVALRLYLLTKEERYLEWALKMYTWTNETLQRDDGLYEDNIKLDGSIDRTIWSYNQGVPIGVNTLLYRATGDAAYLTEAQRIADAASEFYANGALEKQPPFFNSIYFKNLLLLASETGDRTAHARMSEYAQWAWDTMRQPNGLFIFPNDDPNRAELIENAAMVQIMAVLAWNPKDWGKLY